MTDRYQTVGTCWSALSGRETAPSRVAPQKLDPLLSLQRTARDGSVFLFPSRQNAPAERGKKGERTI